MQGNPTEQLALLNCNNTPSEGIDLSPSQGLFGRRCRTLMPMTKEMLKPRHNIEEEKINIEKTKRREENKERGGVT